MPFPVMQPNRLYVAHGLQHLPGQKLWAEAYQAPFFPQAKWRGGGGGGDSGGSGKGLCVLAAMDSSSTEKGRRPGVESGQL